jgi:hypothetical protein
MSNEIIKKMALGRYVIKVCHVKKTSISGFTTILKMKFDSYRPLQMTIMVTLTFQLSTDCKYIWLALTLIL